MKLGKPGWLSALLTQAVDVHVPERVLRREGAQLLSARARARVWLREGMRESGLLFGTPRARGDASPSPQTASEELLFLAVIRSFADLALDLAVITGAPAGPRTDQLLVLFASLVGAFPEAQEISRRIGPPTFQPVPRRVQQRIEEALELRAMSLAGDPAYGLVLHNGAVYVDAQTFGRQAIDYFSRGVFRPAAAQRRHAAGSRRKALMVDVLAALACAERQPSYPTRRAILRQIEDLRLPHDVSDPLRSRVKRYFERRPRSGQVVKGIRAYETRRFLLQQALLAARVDGRTSPEERAFLEGLAAALGFHVDEVQRIEVEVAEFYARNRHLVDVFTVSAAAGVMGEEVVDAMQTAVEKNFHRLMREIRETGELSVLLSRVARGQTLTRDEQKRMRAQLIDVAKAIPALAIFAAPGGVLLLIALAKVLPFSLLPSAFTDDADADGGDDEWAPGTEKSPGQSTAASEPRPGGRSRS